MLQHRKIILGVSGSIAAYKAVFLLRLLKKAGATVRVVLTPAVSEFVGELTFSSLADGKVFSGLWGAGWSEHVEWGTWADLMIVAPATANTLGKMANGLCDNALTAVYLSARCPVMIAPAMDADMFLHPRVQANLEALKGLGNQILLTGTGFLASGLEGPGRLLEPEEILAHVIARFSDRPLAGKKVLITAGPTREPIDPVRYISNYSSGKMGYALAEEAQRLGATVTLVSGPTSLPAVPGVKLLRVSSTAEMMQAVMSVADEQEILILSAAVSDYTPATVADQKIKKKTDEFSLELKKTPDILRTLGEQKRSGQLLVGFALETENELENALKKLRSKNLDLIVLNSLADPGAGFSVDTNKITLIDKNEEIERFPVKPKREVAADILARVCRILTPQ